MKRIIFALSMMGAKSISLIGIFIFAKFLSVEEINLFSKYQSIFLLLIPILSIQLPAAIFRFSKEKRYQSTVNYITKFSLNLYLLVILLIFFGGYLDYAYIVFAAVISNFIYQINIENIRAMSKESDYYKCNFLFTLLYIIIATCFVSFYDDYIFLFLADIIASSIVVLMSKILVGSNNAYYKFNPARFYMLCKYSIPLVSNALLWWFSTSGAILISNFLFAGQASAVVNINAKASLAISTFAFIMSSITQRSMVNYYVENKNMFYVMFSRYVMSSIVILIICSAISYFVFRELLVTYYMDYYISDFLILVNVLSGIIYGICAILGLTYICEKKTTKAMTSVICGVVVTAITLLFMPVQYGVEGVSVCFMFGFLANLLVRIWDYTQFKKRHQV